MRIDELFEHAVNTPSDIWEHVPVLHKYASTVGHVTEFGTNVGNSTSAFLFARPRTLITYDVERHAKVSELETAAAEAGIDFRFCQADVRTQEIAPTDLLFIDTRHAYEQMKAELRQAPKVAKYIILHDTETFGIRGENAEIGIWPAVSEFLRNQGDWKLHAVLRNNNGLTILERADGRPGKSEDK